MGDQVGFAKCHGRRNCASKSVPFAPFHAQVAKASTHYEGSFVSIDVLLTWGTNSFASTPVKHGPREQGTSGYTFRKLMTHAMNMMTGFSTMPLQMASLIGFVFTLFGLAVLSVRSDSVLREWGFCAGFPVPCVHRRVIFRSAAIRPWYHRGILSPYAFPQHAETSLRCP